MHEVNIARCLTVCIIHNVNVMANIHNSIYNTHMQGLAHWANVMTVEKINC